MRWDRFAAKIAEAGGIVEEWIAGDGVRSPSVQLRITPLGDLEIISTHDQILGGPSGPGLPGVHVSGRSGLRAARSSRMALRVGEVLKTRGVLGRFGVDFVSVPRRGRLAAFRHRDQPAQGRHDAHVPDAAVPDTGALRRRARRVRDAGGASRCYYATDNVVNPLYRRLTREDLVEVTDRHDLHFDATRQRGVVFNLIGALSEFGKIGVVAIDEDRRAAQALFRDTVRVLDEEAARG